MPRKPWPKVSGKFQTVVDAGANKLVPRTLPDVVACRLTVCAALLTSFTKIRLILFVTCHRFRQMEEMQAPHYYYYSLLA